MSATYSAVPAHSPHHDRIRALLRSIFSTLLGINPMEINDEYTFLQLGAESLQLLQAGQAIQETFGVKVQFRLLIEKLPTIAALTDYLAQQVAPQPDALRVPPPSVAALEPSVPQPEMQPGVPAPSNDPVEPALAARIPERSADTGAVGAEANSFVERLFAQQLQIMEQQIALLQKGRRNPTASTTRTLAVQQPTPVQAAQPATASPAPRQAAQPASANTIPARPTAQPEFVAFQPLQADSRGGLTERQQQHIAALTQRLTTRMRRSKEHSQEHRQYLADNRVVTGFRLSWKELCYPLVVERGQGARIWDIDGNEYVDLTMGFGSLLFGHSPEFITEALKQEPALGLRLGPQSYLAGKVAKLLCELTGTERAAFCNSGTEAIMTALRVARAVTGRSRVAIFAGSFHGTFDGTLVRGEETPDGLLKAVPMAPGVVPNMVKDVLFLRYNDPRSLELLVEHGHELAAVLIEPPRSRRPDIRSVEFVKELRRITQESGTALIFDEIVTGFRTHPGGVQALFGVQGDMVTYGKAIAGGMPIGVLAGTAHYLDALDGGMWQYGDDSYPEADSTFFAGTFCKHPFTMAATWAVLNHLREQGPQLQEQLTLRTARFVETLNDYFQAEQVPIQVVHFGSLFRFIYPPELRYMDMFFFHMLEEGIYIWEGRNCFLSTAHTEADIEQIIRAVKTSITAMRAGEFLPPAPTDPSSGPPSSNGSHSRELVALTTNGRAAAPMQTSPLSEAQKQLWVLAQMSEEASIAYHLSMALKLHGNLSRDALHAALQDVIARHDALRASFSPQGDSLRIAAEVAVALPLLDISRIEPQLHEEQIDLWLREEARRPFDLEHGPLIRAALLQLDPQTHLLAITTHHLISDGQSLGAILSEISALYTARVAGTAAALAPSTQFRDYVAWETAQYQSQHMADAEAYWLQRFAGPLPVLQLPSDHPRPPVQTFAGTRYVVTFDGKLRSAVHRLSREQSCTPFMTLLSGFFTLLHRLSGQSEVVVGVPVAGQLAMKAEHLVGYCVNLLPLSSQIGRDDTLAQQLSAVRQTLFDAYEHQIYPFSRLIKKLNPPRDASRPPLVTVAFNLDHTPPTRAFGDLQAELISNPVHAAQFDIDLNIVDTGSSLVLECDYSTDLFEPQTIERWLGHYATILEGMAANVDQPVAGLALLTDAERRQVLRQWNETDAPYVDQRCFHELFEAQARRTPERVAVVDGSTSLTYRELNERANRLARALIDQGVQRDSVVGLLAERGHTFLTAILAIFKAGGAYLPLDPLYPAQRVAQSLAQSRSPLVVVAAECQPLLREALEYIKLENQPQTAVLESLLRQEHASDNLSRGSHPNELAYVIYTSGSTGLPKGAMVEQRGMINHLYAKLTGLQLTHADRVAQTASQCFDISVWQFLVALLNGGQVQILDNEIAHDPAALLDRIEQGRISILEIVPSLLRLLLEEIARRKEARPALSSLRWLISTGEALAPELARQWFQWYPNIRLMNAYGPTECSDDVTHYVMSQPPELDIAHVPIGQAVINTQLYVLDPWLEPTPIGVSGELYVGGTGVGRGYLHDPARTSQVFLPDPFSTQPGARLYKTGDLARFLPDGAIEFLQRVDHQIKIRGFRIELGEIEASLRQHTALDDVVVVAREDKPGAPRLVAYVVLADDQRRSTDHSAIVTELRGFLKQRLPDYMVPAAFVVLEALPLTANGKINRQELPAPDQDRAASNKHFVPPITPIEKQLAAIWSQVLNLTLVGVDDNFFELGGDSILGIQIITRANEAGLRLSPKHVFQYQTIAELARVAVPEKQAGPDSFAEQGVVQGDVPLTPIQHWFVEQQFAEPHHFNLATLQEVREPIDPVLLEQAFQHLLAHHDALRLRFFQEAGIWRQINAGIDQGFTLNRLDVSALAETEQAAALEREATRLQSSLDLRAGPILRAALFHLGAHKPDRLFICVHHLAMDIFSWNVLLEHLQILYRQLKHGEQPALPPKTTSYKQWAERLTEHAQSATLREELRFWRDQIPAHVADLPVDMAEGRSANTETSGQVVELSLSREETQALLQEVPKVYRTQINDVLLAALGQAFERWTGGEPLLIDLEGHGREALFDDVNVTRTIGWFTAIYPVLLALGESSNPGDALKTIKEHLRAIPHGGIGYGMLRYLCTNPEVAAQMRMLPKADVCFNYLGQLNRAADHQGLFAPAAGGRGLDHSQSGQRSYLLEINGLVRNGQLTMVWGYSSNVHHRTTIEQVARDFMDTLRGIIKHCQSPDSGGVTPSDFGLNQLSQQNLDSLLAKIKFTR